MRPKRIAFPAERLAHALAAFGRLLLTLAGLAAPGVAGVASAVTLRPGDVILVSYRLTYYDTDVIVWRLDPATMDSTRISTGGLLTNSRAGRVAVDRRGRILVADPVSGIVSINAETGGQSVLASPAQLGGISPLGIEADGDAGFYVSGSGAGGAAVLHLTPDADQIRVVTSGDLLSSPAGVAIGPDGQLYIAESSHFTGYFIPYGSIVRVDPSTGAQTLFSADSVFYGPFDIAVSSDGYLWTAQLGQLSGRGAYFVRTRIADAQSDIPDYGFHLSEGIAIGEGGQIYLGDCSSHGPDCVLPFVQSYPGGPRRGGVSGALAIVPSGVTPTHHASWGQLKLRYR